MVLVNGSEGIGTGWSTNIPSFNPDDIVRNIRHLMDDEELEPLYPWFRGWTGTVEIVEKQRYRMYGRIEQVGPNKLEITELPAKTWTSTIKEYLLLGISGNERNKPWIKDMEEQHSHDIKFIITLTDEEMKKTKKVGFYERFKLISPISMLNMVGFNSHGKINRYNDPNDILTEFYYVRLEYYQKRKDYLTEILQWELEKLSYQVKFIKMIVDKQLTVTNKPRKQIMGEFETLGFPRFNKKGKPYYGPIESNEKADDEDTEENNESNNNNLEEGNDTVNGPEETYGTFEYLLGMRIWSLTKERYDKLMKQQQEKQTELESLLKLSAKDIWNNDLDEFSKAYDEFIKLDQEMREGESENKKSKASAKRKRGRNDEDFDPNKKKPKRRLTKKIKEEANFKRVLLKPKAVVKPKRVLKIKTEAVTKEDSTVQSEAPLTTGQNTPELTADAGKNATIFDNVVKKEEPASGISAFTSKFKKITDVFDKMDTKEVENTAETSTKEGQYTTDSSSKDEQATLVDTTEKSTAKKDSPKKSKKSVELSDESDLEILSDAQDDDNDEEIQPRKRNSRARTPKKSYVEEAIELSDDSFIDDDDENDEVADDSDASFGFDQ